MSDWYSPEGAKNDSGKFTGVHIVRIKEAEKIITDSGSEGIKLRVSFMQRTNAEGKNKELTLDTVWLMDKNGKRPDADRISALFMICQASPKKIRKFKVERYNFDTKEKEMIPVPMYEELIGKQVAVFIQLKKVFPIHKINPETNTIILDRNEKGIFVPNYQKERKLSFVFVRAFYADSLRTYSEKTSDKTAKVYAELTDRYDDYEEKQMDYDDLIKFMKKKSDEAGLKFSGQAFSNDGYGKMAEEDEVPDIPDADFANSDDVPF